MLFDQNTVTLADIGRQLRDRLQQIFDGLEGGGDFSFSIGMVHFRHGEERARVLSRLLSAEGRVVPRPVLLEALGDETGAGRGRSLDVLVHRLRRKLGEGGSVFPRILLTVHGAGYRIGVPVAES